MRLFILILFIFISPFAMAIDGTIKSALDKLGDAALNETEPIKSLLPKEFPTDLTSKELEVQEITGLDLGSSGRAFGAIGYQRLPYSSKEIATFLHKNKTPFELVSNVKTLRDIHLLSEKHDDKSVEMSIKLAINVPVVSDFHTQIKIRAYEDEKKHGIYEWQSLNDEDDLNYVRGAVVVKAHDEKSSDVYVFGAYVIKPERKVPWLGRGTARSFAKSHYASYITALETGLKNQK